MKQQRSDLNIEIVPIETLKPHPRNYRIKERDYGIRLKQVAPVVKSQLPRKMLEEENRRRGVK